MRPDCIRVVLSLSISYGHDGAHLQLGPDSPSGPDSSLLCGNVLSSRSLNTSLETWVLPPALRLEQQASSPQHLPLCTLSNQKIKSRETAVTMGHVCEKNPPKPAAFLLAWSCLSTQFFWQKISQDGWAKWPCGETGSCQVDLKRAQGNRTRSWRWDCWLKMQAQKSSSNLLNTTFPLQKKKKRKKERKKPSASITAAIK